MINDFGIYLTNVRGYGVHTVTAYISDVRAFAHWAKDNIQDARWSKILREDIDDYMSYLIQQGRKASTINRTLSSISAFYRFLKRSGYDVENPCKYESRLIQEQITPNTIQENELREAYEASTGVVRTIIGVLANTGIRLGELLSITWADINWQTHAILIHGKGRKQRKVFLYGEEYTTLYDYWAANKPTGEVFQFSPRKVRHMVYDALKPYCHAVRISPHAIRHTYATALANEGVNVSCIANILGHSSLKASQRYIDGASLNVMDIQKAKFIV